MPLLTNVDCNVGVSFRVGGIYLSGKDIKSEVFYSAEKLHPKIKMPFDVCPGFLTVTDFKEACPCYDWVLFYLYY